MKGLLAPQNTFLDTIATRFDGTREWGSGWDWGFKQGAKTFSGPTWVPWMWSGPKVSRVSGIEGPRTPEAAVKEQDWELSARVGGVRPRVQGGEEAKTGGVTGGRKGS